MWVIVGCLCVLGALYGEYNTNCVCILTISRVYVGVIHVGGKQGGEK